MQLLPQIHDLSSPSIGYHLFSLIRSRARRETLRRRARRRFWLTVLSALTPSCHMTLSAQHRQARFRNVMLCFVLLGLCGILTYQLHAL